MAHWGDGVAHLGDVVAHWEDGGEAHWGDGVAHWATHLSMSIEVHPCCKFSTRFGTGPIAGDLRIQISRHKMSSLKVQ